MKLSELLRKHEAEHADTDYEEVFVRQPQASAPKKIELQEMAPKHKQKRTHRRYEDDWLEEVSPEVRGAIQWANLCCRAYQAQSRADAVGRCRVM